MVDAGTSWKGPRPIGDRPGARDPFAATIRKVHRVLSLVVALAVKDGRLARNPAAGVNLPRVVRSERRFLTHAQVEQLAEASAAPDPEMMSKYRRHSERGHDEYRLIVLFLAYTGVRFGEMAALRVGRLDFLRRRATIALRQSRSLRAQMSRTFSRCSVMPLRP
jgi:integrase